VRVGEGPLGFASVGVVERLTEPLAKAGIPVLYVSTYSTDYCLLPKQRLEAALDCLMPVAAPATPPTPVREPSASTHSHPLTVLDEAPSHVLRLDKRQRQRHMGALLRLLFMPQQGDTTHAIAALTETADEISLIASSSAGWWAEYVAAEGLQQELTPQEWVPIRVGDAVPVSEIGVVASQAKVLADADISILYLSTYFSDYTLVQQQDVERAAAAFEQAGFDCAQQRTRDSQRDDSQRDEADASDAAVS
jgi:hypothetical protein